MSSEGELSPRQAEVLRLITKSVQERGFPPTMAEVLKALGAHEKSKQWAWELYGALERKGFLIRRKGLARAISLTDKAKRWLGRAA